LGRQKASGNGGKADTSLKEIPAFPSSPAGMTLLFYFVITRKVQDLSYLAKMDSDEVIFMKQSLDRFVPRDDFMEKIPKASLGMTISLE